MLEQYQFIQTCSLWAMLIFGILSLISLAIWRKSGLEIQKIKDKTNQELSSKNKTDIIGKIEENKNQAVLKDEINVSNALIFTKDQKGGINTVINQKVDIPLPLVKLDIWEVKNRKVTETEYHIGNPKITFPNERIKEKFLYHNKVKIKFISEVTRNSIGFMIKIKDIKIGEIIKNGRVQCRSGITKEGWFLYILKQPENGIYILDFYSVNQMENIMKYFEYK